MRFLPSSCVVIGFLAAAGSAASGQTSLWDGFVQPPPAARPGVYWYFLDGNRSEAAMTAELGSMARVGLGSALVQEVDLGVPRGPVNFMSDAWQEMFVHAVRDGERLGVDISLGSGPGWAGSGGPWVKPEESMQHLVASTIQTSGPSRYHGILPVPPPRKPYFETLTPELKRERNEYYRDVAVLAFPSPAGTALIPDADEKALYYRPPYTSRPGVKAYFPPSSPDAPAHTESAIAPAKILDLTSRLQPDGTLDWDVPAGNWTIMRFVARNNGANSRPAPRAGYGFECDKFSATALQDHLQQYAVKLLERTGPRKAGAGWTTMHLDSWEMGAQNWTPKFREEFTRRRGYDPLPWFPAYTGRIVENAAATERFLWDLRQTAQELVIENYAGQLAKFAHEHQMGLEIEPYDMNPTADLELGAVADVPMGEFWANTFNSAFSCIEAASIAHTMGRPVVGAESFTSEDAFMLDPAALKNQLDWAFATGINRILFHTFEHQPLGPEALPGLTFGPYGVNWNSNQTWWPMVDGVHRYISRCSYLLRQGVTVADILYLTPEGAPQVFRAPASAVTGDSPILPDRQGYNFDGCAPGALMGRARVREGRIEFPGGSSYRVLVLPAVATMTPALLKKVGELIAAGATVIGGPPARSPSLSDYPQCDLEVRKLAETVWGASTAPAEMRERAYGHGHIFWGGEATQLRSGELYPSYDVTAGVLRQLALPPDFQATGPIRYTHRRTGDRDLYFVANRSGAECAVTCAFRTDGGAPEIWDAMTGTERAAASERQDGVTSLPLTFAAYQSFFIVFDRSAEASRPLREHVPVVTEPARSILALDGSWEVDFPPGRGAPAKISLTSLEDWTTRPESGVRYFSGIATYRKHFDLPAGSLRSRGGATWFLELGTVKDICRVRLNGVDLGVVWSAPWHVDISAAVRPAGNRLEIEVANRWPNRLIGDQQPEDANARILSWKDGLLAGRSFKTGRYTFALRNPYKANSPLLSSGLLGPVSIVTAARN